MFTTKTARRITIILDSTLKSVILDKVTEMGAKGYNYTECKGKGAHAVTGDFYGGDNLIRVEVITSMEIGAAILDYVHAAQFAQLGQYALAAFADTVEVDLRDHSFSE